MRLGGGWPWVVGTAVMLGVVAGVRQQTGPVLLPVWLYAFSRFSRLRLAKLIVGAMVFGCVCLSWFLPMVELSGGLTVYLHLLSVKLKMEAQLTPWGGGVVALSTSCSAIVASCWNGLYAAGLLAGTEFFLSVLRLQLPVVTRHKEQFIFLAVWVVPMVAIGLVVYTTMPGYVLCYFPALATMSGLALVKVARRFAECWSPVGIRADTRGAMGMAVVLGIVSLLNAAIFLLPVDWTKNLRAGMSMQSEIIRHHDAQLARWFRAIRSDWSPNEVLVCHYGQSFFWGFRHFQYHLPEYDNCLLTADRALAAPWDKRLWYARNRRVSFVDRFDTLNKGILILVVSPGDNVERFARVLDASRTVKWEIDSSEPLYTLRSERNHTD
jgi:hypothetical protein